MTFFSNAVLIGERCVYAVMQTPLGIATAQFPRTAEGFSEAGAAVAAMAELPFEDSETEQLRVHHSDQRQAGQRDFAVKLQEYLKATGFEIVTLEDLREHLDNPLIDP